MRRQFKKRFPTTHGIGMKKVHCCLALIAWVCLAPSFAQDAKFSALYIINFGKYIGWPAQASSGAFAIAVLGDDPVYNELKTLSADAKIGDQSVTVVKSPSLDKIDKCNILFISPDKSNSLATALGKFASSNTLVVTNKEGLAQLGAAINLVSSGGKLTFEINVESLKKSGLSAKPALFKLGKTI